MDHFAIRIERAMHAHSLANIFLHFVLVVDVVGLAAGFILQHVLVALLYDGAAESLRAASLRRASLR